MNATLMAGAVLAATRNEQPEDIGKAGPLGLLLIGLLLIAVVLLVKSMTRHLKRVPRSFDGQPDVVVPDSPAELMEPEGGEQVLDRLRQAPRAIEPPRRDGDGGATAR
jgi:hypothetical protein